MDDIVRYPVLAPAVPLAADLRPARRRGRPMSWLLEQALLARLRSQSPPVIARIEDDQLVLDLRTVFPEDDSAVTAALKATLDVAQSSAR